MFLAELSVQNFRKIKNVKLEFREGLNLLVGPNNIGKTAIVDALRSLLAGQDEPFPRLTVEDIHQPHGEARADSITFGFVFRGLGLDDEADFLPALVPGAGGALDAHIAIRYSQADKSGRLKPKRWCGDKEDLAASADLIDNLRGVYLPPLRDASQGLKPGRTSQLARLLQLLTDDKGRDSVASILKELDDRLKKEVPIVKTQEAISARHNAMLGAQLAQVLDVGLSATDFQRLASRLSLAVNAFEIEQNGLGFNNLIYMAVVLSELTKNPDAAYRGLIVEEPEAHLHPQLQAVLLQYLSGVSGAAALGDKPVQVFLTTHSPTFACAAKLDSLGCLGESKGVVHSFFPRTVKFEPGKREKLERYLDATRAEIFFARRIIFVEGAAELILLWTLAEREGINLRQHGVSVISVEGLNFDSFLPLFGDKALAIPVSVLTDADPSGTEAEEYPVLGASPKVSATTAKMQKLEDKWVKVFHGVKTFEYDLALHEENRATMVSVLKDLHPNIGVDVETQMAAATDSRSQASVLFRGMFERASKNVQKGAFGQALAQAISDVKIRFTCPNYIKSALKHACQ